MNNKQLDTAVEIIGAGIGSAILVGGLASIFGSTTFTLIAGAIGALIGCMFQANKS